ncbi:MAG: hypothetical protein H6R10_696 [Rhodocyclaceae bacterium]|nr:hypothetical protein [Rhodocyclaceae bacterium]
MSKYRRHMATETRALCWARKHGTAGVVERLLSDGCVAVEPAMIQVGDIALVDLPGNIGAAVCLGRTYLSSTLERGVAMFEPYHLAAPVSVLGVR